MPTEKKTQLFSMVELLVHPLFALENTRTRGIAGTSRNLSENEALSLYENYEFTKTWKTRMDAATKQEKTIFVIIGPREQEVFRQKESTRNFYEGQLTKKKLYSFTKEYQDLLFYAKKTLGRKLIFISSNIGTPETTQHLRKILAARRLIPDKQIKINAYGEYLTECVARQGKNLKILLEDAQQHFWKGENTSTRLTRLKISKTQNKKRLASLGHHDLFKLRMLKKISRGEAITPLWLARNCMWANTMDLGKLERMAEQQAIAIEKMRKESLQAKNEHYAKKQRRKNHG